MEGHPSVVFASGTEREPRPRCLGPWRGRIPIVNRIFGTIFNMDKIIGGVVRRWPFRLEGARGKIGGIRELLRLTANTERKEK